MKRTVERYRPIHVTVNYPSAGSFRADQGSGSSDGLSPFMARVLDQLSLTAWLPAALVVTNFYLVAGMYLTRDAGAVVSLEPLKRTVLALNDKPVGILLAVIGGIVVMTLITQSLEYVSIRFLEGYWGGSIFTAVPTRLATYFQSLRLFLLDRRAEKIERKAFGLVTDRVPEDFPDNPVGASAAILFGTGQALGHLDQEVRRSAARYFYGKSWMRWAPANMRHRANSLSNWRSAYPQIKSRLMPTRLGNALRSAEDQLAGDKAGAQMRGYLYQHVDSIGPGLMQQHNQHRNRLDMYAVMTMVAVALAVVDAWALPSVFPADLVPYVVAAFFGLSYLSYRGAIAAAIDYGAILVAIDRAIAKDRAQDRSAS